MFQRIAALLMFSLLSACVGTGVKSYSSVMSIADKQQGNVFVLRDMGYVGGGALVAVFINGQQIGEIGNGETAIGKSSIGANYVDARFSGVQGIGINSVNASFTRTVNENKYFIIKMNSGLLSNTLQIIEVSENSFRTTMQSM